MATTILDWNDGTGDKITLTYGAAEGSQSVAVSSDPNGGPTARTRIVTFSASGVSPQTLTITQDGNSGPLPAGYTQVQYLVLPGTSYIDLGLTASEKTDGIEVDLQLTEVTGQMRIVCNNGSRRYFNMYVNGSLGLGYNFGNSWQGMNTITFDTSRHLVGMNHYTKKVWYDTTFGTITSGTSNSGSACTIGGTYSSNPRLKAKVYGAKFWRSGELIQELIMCRNSSNTPFVYDIVNSAFLTISGTGTTCGPDV